MCYTTVRARRGFCNVVYGGKPSESFPHSTATASDLTQFVYGLTHSQILVSNKMTTFLVICYLYRRL